MRRILLVLIIITVLLSGCAQTVDIEAAKEEVLAASKAYNEACIARDTEKCMSFLADDVTFARNGDAGYGDKDYSRESFTNFYAVPENSVNWLSHQIVVAASGDMAYETATSEQKRKREDEVVDVTYRFLAVWVKQADGSWLIKAWK